MTVVGLIHDEADTDSPFVVLSLPTRPLFGETINLQATEWAGRWMVKHIEHPVPSANGCDVLAFVVELSDEELRKIGTARLKARHTEIVDLSPPDEEEEIVLMQASDTPDVTKFLWETLEKNDATNG